MRYQVFLTEDAQRDLEELHEYITKFDSSCNADSVLTRVLEVVESLATFPERGTHPKELLVLAFASTARLSLNPTGSSIV
jgi:toxin ParE1/3/4